MKNHEEKYTWQKENIEDLPPINFFQILIGLLRLTCFLPVTIFIVVLFLLSKAIFKPLNLNYPIFLIRKSWSLFILRLFGLKLEVVGKLSYTSTIFVSNHISWTDILVIQSIIDIIFIAKSDVKKMPGLGFLASIANTVFIDRNPQKISKDSNILRKIIKKGELICFFPEGTSTDGLRVLKFKSGFFQLLFDSNNVENRQFKKVQPISLIYKVNNKNLSKDFYGWWGDMSIISHITKILCLSTGSVVIKFHEPLDSREFNNRKDIALAAENIIAKEISFQLSTIN
ncbi:MAG: lysophospholipid acyltransferase family protein [Paracoccaceae bacterium]